MGAVGQALPRPASWRMLAPMPLEGHAALALARTRRALRVALAAATLVGAAGIALHLAQLEVVSLAHADAAAVEYATVLDASAFTLALLELATLVLGAALFAAWTARLCDAAAASGVALSARARGRAVGAWITPVVQLARPPRILASLVAEVYAVRGASVGQPESDVGYRETVRKARRAPQTVILAWWALWIASRVAESAGVLLGNDSVEAFRARLIVDVGADALLVCAGMMAQVVIGEVDDAMRAS